MLFEFEVAANRMRKKFLYNLLMEFILIVLCFMLYIFSSSVASMLMLILFFWTLFCFSRYFSFRKAKKDLRSFVEQNMLQWLEKRGWLIAILLFFLFCCIICIFYFPRCEGYFWIYWAYLEECVSVIYFYFFSV